MGFLHYQSRSTGRRAPYVAVLLLAWLAVAGLAGAQSVSIRRYAHDQGLVGLAGTCLLQTRATLLWVCTESGLYRYNGRIFKQMELGGLRNEPINAMSQAADGQLWVAGFKALFVGDEHGLRKLAPDEAPHLQEGMLLASPAWGTVLANGATLERLSPRSNGRWQSEPLLDTATRARLPELSKVLSLSVEGDTLWAGCARKLCAIDAQRQVQVYGPEQGVPEDRWSSVLRDREGGLWARGAGTLIYRAPGAARFAVRPAPLLDGSTIGRQAPLVMDRQGRVLVRRNDGLLRWEGDHWRSFGIANGLPPGSSDAIVVDRDGDLWMTVDGEGLVRWAGYEWIESWDASQGMPAAPTWAIARDAHDALVVGNEHGIGRQAHPHERFVPALPEAGIQIVGLARGADGSLWTLSSAGQLRRQWPDGRSAEIGKLPRIGRRLHIDRQGRLWVLSVGGLFVVEHPEQGGTLQAVSELPAISYTDIQHTADGTLWVSSANGLFRLQGKQWSKVPVRVNGGAADPWISKFHLSDDGEVWLAFYRPGLWHGMLLDGRLDLQAVSDEAMRDVGVYLLRGDSVGRIWVGHARGVEVYNGERWAHLSQSQGLLWDDVSEAAFAEDPDGSVWIGTSRGISHLHDPGRLFEQRLPSVRIDSVSRGGVPVQRGQLLGWSDKPLHIELSSMEVYDDPSRLSVRYRLLGLHEEWIQGNELSIDQPPLPSGHFRLQVQLFDRYRRTVSPVVDLPFAIAPLWWRSPPAIALYVLIGGGLLIGLWRWRHRHLVARERMLAELVAERTYQLEREKRDLESARAALALKASHDALTGLLNRSGILEAMAEELLACASADQPLAVVLIDLDHFKQINDEHGHLIGDAVLARVGARLTACLRDSDKVGRYGGEELLVLLPGMQRQSQHRLRAIHEAIGVAPYEVGAAYPLQVTCSIGVSWFRPGDTAATLLARADEALYRAKRHGRNRIEPEEPDVSAA
ncbi:ligand-binding sensor domain-containing diguanylate cyclase [Xanthomonas cucurbitae]|uniref:diguanylate cyclase n=1 Tax=Xanthomonas cucurbitae TaxID=56453 RepID=A0A2S7DG79_9XANT|nr:ligand-binding sensor domain-containing diguanylate cyclase [Xanthomonas cucurbitae]PPU72754.1 GGDEF domain-containing protein [Xanthomonas cucurbitae]WDM69326.1 diguanylate cyclase [Xanthomonas cucurbitae]WDM73199.1 diguanylate cyclase [Xanthomonas cucurbitae]WDM77656.1 diguanylate cyclase [Xanthomonas cucurbitae]WDM81333.1 diguanylate cyclase [Xanthomonas cucurbitae]